MGELKQCSHVVWGIIGTELAEWPRHNRRPSPQNQNDT